MKTKIFLAGLVLGIQFLSAQVNWINTNMFEQKNFIENKGQFDTQKIPNGETVLYSTHIDGVQYFFTKSGYTIVRKEREQKTKDEMEKEERRLSICQCRK